MPRSYSIHTKLIHRLKAENSGGVRHYSNKHHNRTRTETIITGRAEVMNFMISGDETSFQGKSSLSGVFRELQKVKPLVRPRDHCEVPQHPERTEV